MPGGGDGGHTDPHNLFLSLSLSLSGLFFPLLYPLASLSVCLYH